MRPCSRVTTGRWPLLLPSSLILLLAGSVLAADFPGVLRWAGSMELGLLESGIVGEVLVAPGQSVARGELLLRLEPREFNARLAAARARLRDAAARYAEARREAKRADELYERTLSSDHERQLAANDAVFARAARDRAKAEVELAELALERSELKAPFAGIVSDLSVAPGMAVSNRLRVTPLLRLTDTSAMFVELHLPLASLASLTPGAAPRVKHSGRFLPATLREIRYEAPPGDVASTRAPRYRVTLRLSAVPADARAGMPVDVRVE